MMSIRFFSIALLILCLEATGQTVQLAKILTGEDKAFLDQKLIEAMAFAPSVNITYDNKDLYGKIKKHDKPCSLDDVKKLEKTLKGTSEDAIVYNNMGQLYKRLHMHDEANRCFNQALDIEKVIVEKHPDSCMVLINMAMVYVNMSRLKESKELMERVLEINPLDTVANTWYPSLYMFSGEFDEAKTIFKEQIKKYANTYSSYDFLPLCDIYKLYAFIGGNADTTTKRNFLLQNAIIEMEPITSYYKKDTASVHRFMLYHVAGYYNTGMRIICNTLLDGTKDLKNFKIKLSDRDTLELNAWENKFTACLNRKDIKNKYLVYKILGNIYFLKGEYKRAIPFLKKTIELKPLSQSSLLINASEDYDNLASIYYLMKDTLAAEKLILRKYKIRPAVDAQADDSKNAALVYLRRHDLATAEKLFLESIALEGSSLGQYLGLAVTKYLTGHPQESNVYIKKAFNQDNTDWRLYLISGVMTLKQGDAENAYFLLQKAKELSELDWIETDIIKKYISTEKQN